MNPSNGIRSRSSISLWSTSIDTSSLSATTYGMVHCRSLLCTVSLNLSQYVMFRRLARGSSSQCASTSVAQVSPSSSSTPLRSASK